jgi:hypothetical protein
MSAAGRTSIVKTQKARWAKIRAAKAKKTRGLRSEKTGEAMKKYKFKAKIEAGDGEGAYVLFP